MSTKFKFPIGAYLLLPVLAIVLEILLAWPKLLTYILIDPEVTFASTINNLVVLFQQLIDQVFS